MHRGGRGRSGRSDGCGGRSLGDRIQRNGGPFANLQLSFLKGLFRGVRREDARGGVAKKGGERGVQ